MLFQGLRNSGHGCDRRGFSAIAVVFMILVATAAVGGGAWYFIAGQGDGVGEAPVLTVVETGPFDHVVLEQGEVESSSNVDIMCNVKARNSTGTAILWVIDEGSLVKKGDLLVQLDKSALDQELKQQKTIVNTARAAHISAKSKLEQAKVALDEYLKGTFAQEEKTIESEILTAEETLSRAKETAQYSQRLTAQGFQTTVQLRADQFRVKQAEVALNLALQKLETLREITKKKMLIGFNADIETADAMLAAEVNNLSEEVDKLADFEIQIKNCDLTAPEAGQVVHANQFSSRGGSAEFVVEPGAMVRERQVIIRLPDPNNMRIKAKINESQVSLVREGMPVSINIGAYNGELKGFVTKVNKYAEPGNWFSSQVKEYVTYVHIVDPPETIRTGMTSEVRIFVNQIESVLQLPVQAVHEYKGHHFCLVTVSPEAKSFETRAIKIGFSNDKKITIAEGLSDGELVVMNPRRYVAMMQLPDIPDEPKVELTPEEQKAAQEAKAKALAGGASAGAPGAAEGGGAGEGGRGGPGRGGPGRGGPGRGGPGEGGPGRGGQAAAGPAGGGGFAMDADTMVDRTFEQFDADKDGKLSSEEMGGMPERQRTGAEQADGNADGLVDRAEMLVRMKEVVKRIQEGGFGGGGGQGGN